jgi:type I restriction enzyme, S subunit
VNELPEGWLETSLADVAQWGSGGTPSRTHSEYYGGSIPWIKTGELGQRVITETEETITELGLQNSSAKIFPKGSVAIAMYGATIGKTSVLGIDAATNQACAVAIPETRLATVEYLFRFLESQKAAFVEAGKGGAQPNISQGVIKEWLFPLAPLNEQKRIAEKLEALLTQATSSLEKLNRASELVKRFRQSVLAAAMSGKLTEDPSDLVSPNQSDNKYPFLKLTNLIQEPLRNGRSVRDGDGPKVLRLTSIKSSTVDLSASKNGEWTFDEARRFFVKAGDYLISRGNGSIRFVGIGSLIIDEPEEIAFPDTMIRIRADLEKLDPKFFAIVWSSELVRNQIESSAKTTAGIWKVNQTDLENIILPVPSLPEQLEIVSRVETLFALADQLETRINTARAQLERLTPALLAKAFRGELVPQDPNDEPATVLLERIREARASQPKQRKPRQTKTIRQGAAVGGMIPSITVTPPSGSAEITPSRSDQASLFTAGGQTVKRLEDVTPDHLTRTITQRGRNELALEAKTLWQASELSIDDFYVQLGREVTGGLLRVNGDQPALVEVA